jgi:hypothetical protein
MSVFPIVLGFLACAATSLALGIPAVRVLRLELNRAEAGLLGAILGAALTSCLTLALALLGIAREEIFLVLTTGSVLLLALPGRWLRRLSPAPFSTIPTPLLVLFVLAWVAYGVLYFRQAVSPEMSPDGMAYHLGLVNLWSHAHGLSRSISIFAALPDGMEMLFLFAFTIGRHSAATLVHFGFLMLLPWLMLLYGCRFGWSSGAAVLAALLVFASPLVGIDGTSAYNDVGLAVFTFAAIYLLQQWRRTRSPGSLLAAGFLAGFSFAVKYTAGPLLLIVAGTALWELRRRPKEAARAALLVSIAMIIAPAPYLIRNVIWYQNPVAFLGNKVFPNRWFHISFEEGYREAMAHPYGVHWSELPRELTFGGVKLDGSFGPEFILLPLALVGLFWPQTRMVVLAGIFLALPFVGNKSGRFLMAAAPPLAMAAAFVLGRLPRSTPLIFVLALGHLVMSWPSFNNRLKISSGWRIVNHVPWSAALRIEPEQQYLRRADEFALAQLIETHVPAAQPVLVFSDAIAQSYTTRPILIPWGSAFAERMIDLIQQASHFPDYERTWNARFPRMPIGEVRIVQTAREDRSRIWSVNEIRLWNGPAQIKPESPVLNAQPNPWDMPLALDGSAITRWRSWEALRPGMWIDLKFEPAETIDRIEILCADGGYGSEMAARVRSGAGAWITVPSSWSVGLLPDLRRQATAELKHSGVQYLEVNRDEWAKIFHGDFTGWGVRLVASSTHSLLLKVD